MFRGLRQQERHGLFGGGEESRPVLDDHDPELGRFGDVDIVSPMPLVRRR